MAEPIRSTSPVIEFVDVGKTYSSGSLEVEALRGSL